MRRTDLRDRYGLLTGISVAVPTSVHAEIEAEARRVGISEAEVLRTILLGWARRHGPVYCWWAWDEAACHAAPRHPGRPGRALCGAKLDRRACLDLGRLPPCPRCNAIVSAEAIDAARAARGLPALPAFAPSEARSPRPGADRPSTGLPARRPRGPRAP